MQNLNKGWECALDPCLNYMGNLVRMCTRVLIKLKVSEIIKVFIIMDNHNKCVTNERLVHNMMKNFRGENPIQQRINPSPHFLLYTFYIYCILFLIGGFGHIPL